MSERHVGRLIDPADLARGIEDKLITIREALDGQKIYNYSDAALYTPGAWDNPAVRQCRGLIANTNGQIVARPWAKFFNYGQAEAGALDLDAPVEVTDKMDGSLGIIHLDESGRLRVATRGSFESDQALHATEWLTRQGWRLDVIDFTPLVEIIYPANRIVCDYGDRDELVLLGCVNIETGSYYGPEDAARLCEWPGALTEVFAYHTLRDALAAKPRPGAEGMCVRYLSDVPRIVKIKQEDYIRLHKIVTGLSERSIWEHMSNGADLGSLLGTLPDELHDWTRDVWERIDLAACIIECRARDQHTLILDGFTFGFERRDYAEAAKQHGPLAPLLFQLLDGKDIRPSILRTLKPEGCVRAKAISEATA